MPRPLPSLLALLLGVGAALLVACGGGTKGGLPAASAGDLKSEFEDIQQAVDDGRCDDVPGQLRQVDERIDELPGTVDERLQQRLRDASDGLHRLAANECNDRETTTSTPTQTQTTETQEAPPETQTAPPQTTTAPPQTTTTPPTVVPPPVPPPVAPPVSPPIDPAEPPAPPPGGGTPGGTPGGGATPEVQP